MKPYPENSLPFAAFIDDLAAEVAELVADVETTGRDGRPVRGVHAYAQELPVIRFELDDMPPPGSAGARQSVLSALPLPYCLVRLYESGTDEQENIWCWVSTAEIQFGIRFDDPDNQGHRPLLEMMQRVADRFSRNRVLADRYTALQDMRILLQDSDESVPPFYFGSVVVRFMIPKNERRSRYT